VLVLGCAFALVLSLAAGYVGMRMYQRHESVANAIGSIFIPAPQSYFHKDRIRVLVLGIDYNYDAKDQEYSDGARSDTIMALSINFPTSDAPQGSISILSVPRDTVYDFPHHGQDKINAAYSFGGVRASEKYIADFLGVPGFDRYVVLRINAMKELIDAIGGIDIVPDETMSYDDSWGHLHIHFTGGKLYHMSGDQAVSYSRFRHDACSDPCRIQRQWQVVHTLITKLKNERINDLLHVRQLIKVVNDNVITNFKVPEEESLALGMSGLDPAAIRTAQVPYLRDVDLPCCGSSVIADDDAKRALVTKLFFDPLPRMVVPTQDQVIAIAPSTIRVEVLNGAGRPGLAGQVANQLRGAGFRVVNVGNAPAPVAATQIQVHSTAQAFVGDRVRLALSRPSVAILSDSSGSPEASSDVTLILGSDWSADSQKEASAYK
jgi:LCP family protein required for cell wall assembly